ncbi:3-oxoacyl-[acyl-carrier-protein] synthase III C-terminal domain-containing protein [Streptomyces sp. V4-01]|uniref:3-oxoacyl-[acyl-carrier-protein] synthase III C-terminal domain-containing protein n=1 Tax=Actinacidiphila polyblastidii TaxID=3110430 RepID=A0ABU7P5D6_9ACTN|nr:3-oxoacyl-[acyl-carrier-protein] synthase III C-terminal domain-containing protein [Streptomyces sp. V4-01]
MSRIAAVHAVLPRHRYEQHEIRDALAEMAGVGRAGGPGRGLLDRMHAASAVRSRHLALPLERYAALGDFDAANQAYVASALELGEAAARGAFAGSGVSASDVELVVFTSVTGLAVPSIDARLAGRLGLRADVKRLPVFGLGCVAGAAGLARVHDYLAGRPAAAALLLSVELCSLTVQRADTSVANLVAGALFGDGAAAVVAVGAEHPAAAGAGGPRVVATRSRLYPGTERLLGWDVGAGGFRIVLGGDLPDTLVERLGPEVRDFLADHALKVPDVTGWICHPGGPKVLDAVRAALDLPARALELSWRSLAEVGNLSSASVLHILRDTLERDRPLAGTPGLMLSVGPGLSSELLLLRW